MGTAAKKPKAQRSRRSGVKKAQLVKANLSILKKLGAFVLILGLFSSCIVIAPRHHHGFKHHYHQK